MSIFSSSAPTTMSVHLTAVLERLGLTTYSTVLAQNGFRSWETVLDVTEDDLTTLDFKLGHRRVLQREIATYRGLSSTASLDADGNASDGKSSSSPSLQCLDRQMATPPPREKRRYRRHPKPDTNAPRKPKTAYVNFADDLRASPEISALSFVTIAREVGRQWQELPAAKKRVWEADAARAMQEYEARMDEYKKTEDWRKYQAYLAEFKSQHQPAPTGKRPSLVRGNSYRRRECSHGSPSGSSDSPISYGSTDSTNTEAEQCHNALTLAFGELVSLRGEILGQDSRPYDRQHLPSEDLVRRAMYAFVQGTGSLLYMWSYHEVDLILDRIYRPLHSVDDMTLAECFNVAAMGAHYDTDCFPDRIRMLLYASGTLLFNEKTARLDHLRTMRLLLSTAFYALLEKHLSARYLIAAGLQIARWKCPALFRTQPENVSESWRRVYRSLIFMDCWLSYTLGYASDVHASDISLACNSGPSDLSTIDEQIHTQTSKLGLIAAEISKTLASPELATRENMGMLTAKLEGWRVNVPLMLQLPTLTSSNSPNLTLYQRRAIFMVHIMYLGALVLLYRQLLVAGAEMQLTDGASWSLDLPVEEAQRCRVECAMAGQQIARILQLISFDGTFTKRCWILIYWAFTACIVLLFTATTKLLDGQPPDGVEHDLIYAKACLDMLEACRNFEPIAARYLDTLWPLYNALRDKHHRVAGRAKTSIFSLLQADPNSLSPPIPVSKTEMAGISEQLTTLLTDPFGRKQALFGEKSMRRVLNGDGSCSVFWWR